MQADVIHIHRNYRQTMRPALLCNFATRTAILSLIHLTLWLFTTITIVARDHRGSLTDRAELQAK